jgi:drug/metabolite transporter (DMT)-like permease
MDSRLLRLLSIGLFLAAFGVVFLAWPQIGGQDHVDGVSWSWKLLLGLLFAFSVAKAATAAARDESPWNARLISWILMVALTVAAMGYLTYQAHLNEPDEEESMDLREEDAGTPRAL